MVLQATQLRRTALLAVLLVLGSSACRHRKPPVHAPEEPKFASEISAGNPSEAGQFREGFYGIDANAWRWARKYFQVALGLPQLAPGMRVQLVLQCAIPDVVIASVKSVQLSATINGFQLEPETYKQPGDCVYMRDVPLDKLEGHSALVDFTLDKAMPPTAIEDRELGIIVSQVGLVAK